MDVYGGLCVINMKTKRNGFCTQYTRQIDYDNVRNSCNIFKISQYLMNNKRYEETNFNILVSNILHWA